MTAMELAQQAASEALGATKVVQGLSRDPDVPLAVLRTALDAARALVARSVALADQADAELRDLGL